MSGHTKSFYQSLDQAEEKPILWTIVSLLLAFFIWQVISFGSDFGLLRATPLSGRFFAALWQGIVMAWKFRIGPIVIFVDILLLVIFTIAFINYWPMAPRVKISQTRPPVRTRRVRFSKNPAIASHWGGILNRVKSGTQDAMKSSILEADALVDHFLKSVGFSGEHMADRLTQIVPENVPSLERVWKAHRLRNELAHTPGIMVTVDQAKEALTAFRDFLVELGAL